MEIVFKLKKPSLPNFILLEGVDYKIPVGRLTEEQALGYATFLMYEFFEHWKVKKEQPHD